MDPFGEFRQDTVLKAAVIFAIVIGIIFAIFFLYMGQTTYSALYLNPNSMVHAQGSSEVFFIYGVTCMEKGTTDYHLEIYSGNTLVKSIQFSLNHGETREEGIKIELPPGTSVPEKILMQLHTPEKIEETHFWIK